MIRSAVSLCRRGYTCLFVNIAERQSHLRRYESTFIASMVNQTKERKQNFGGKTKEKEDEEEVIIDNTDETIISKGIFPTKESMDILVDGVPFKDIPIVHIKATGNNTIIIATDKDRVLASASGGTVGFKNAKKGSNVAAQTAAMDVAQKTLFKDVKTVRVCVRGIGPGRLPAIKALESGGLNVISITDTTRFAFNGNRPKKQRRL